MSVVSGHGHSSHRMRGPLEPDPRVTWASVATVIPWGFETRGDSPAVLYSGHDGVMMVNKPTYDSTNRAELQKRSLTV